MKCKHLRLPLALALSLLASTLALAQAGSDSAKTSAADPSVIRKVTTVFKDGVGYDSAKLIAAVKGRVGID